MNGERDIIVVTGSSGFIGMRLIARLAERFTVIGLDKLGPPDRPSQFEFLPVDMTSDDSVRYAFETVASRHGKRLISVVHLAAYFDFSGEPNPLYEQVTVQGTQRLLDGLQSFHVEQFIFSSTMLVHGPCEPGQFINEESPLDPRWPYPESKLKAEQIIHRQHAGIPTVLLRISGVYDDACHSPPLAHQIQRIYERDMTSRVFPGHLSHGQSFLHVDDLVEAFIHAVDRRTGLPQEVVLLVGEPEPLSYDELQHQFGRLIHHEEWETTQIPKAVAKTGAWVQEALPMGEQFIKPWMVDFADDHYALDISRARRLLNWEPTRSLRETLPKMVAALKSDPALWYQEHRLSPLPKSETQAEVRSNRDATPTGWSYNPSTWPQRVPIIALAIVGFGISLYLGLYQWDILPDVWEPLFGDGSRAVLNSPLSHVLPVPDAVLGAVGYLLDAVTGAIGGQNRWRTMPWMVILFGLAVGPLAAVSVFLVIAQPVLLQHWCSLCLISAVIALVMVGPAMDEVLASLQYLKRESLAGRSVWQAFWGGR
jgi:nucleoside-diphosphate-sugar epimerase/uncharacterized membrane protein